MSVKIRHMMPHLKTTAVRVTTACGLAKVFRPLNRRAAVIFMLHRFTDAERGVSGHDPVGVRRLLAYLRRDQYALVSLEDLVQSLRGEGPPLDHAVAFTIDDGYREHATVAAPLFAEFDCPVTTFVTTGFLDGTVWFWWDRIEYVLLETARSNIAVDLDDQRVAYDLADFPGRRAAVVDFVDRCKGLREAAKAEAIQRLADGAEVSLPARIPERYAAMSWAQLREAERRGMTFGPHTVTHPILARTTDARAREEISQSWARLQIEAAHPVPVFAYPNGQAGDFGDRECRLAEQAGLVGAVTGMSGFATIDRHRATWGPFLMPRLPFPDSLPYLIQQVSGMERFKSLLRGEA